MRQKKNIVLILSVFIGLVSFPSEAQENKHSFDAGYFFSPTNPSHRMIYRSDNGSEAYRNATIQGLGIGYSMRVFKFFSPEFNFRYYTINGIDTHSDDEVTFEGIQLRVGGLFHFGKSNPAINLGIGFISGNTRFTDYDNIEEKGREYGLYIGPSMLFKIGENTEVKFTVSGVACFSEFDYFNSYDVYSLFTIHSELAISYVFRF